MMNWDGLIDDVLMNLAVGDEEDKDWGGSR